MELARRKVIVHKFNENPGLSKRKLAKSLQFPESTVRKVIKRYKETLSIERSPRVYHKPLVRNRTIAKTIIRDVVKHPNRGRKKRARDLGTTEGIVRNTLRKEGYKAYHVIKAPRRNDKQCRTVKSRLRKLYDEILTKRTGCILMDDETYQYADTGQTKGLEHYYAKKRLGVADNHKFKYLDKFPEKYLIWQAICSCGMKTDTFVTKGTINADIYLKECLKKRVLPFIRKHRAPIIFWPDLASAHYAKKVLDWYESEGVSFISKDFNPPNCPEIRPIELYWAIIKKKLLANKKTIKSLQGMKREWTRSSAMVTKEDVRRLMGGIKSKVRFLVRGGDKE